MLHPNGKESKSGNNVVVSQNAIVYHTPYYTLLGSYGVTVVAVPDDSGLVLGFSICAPFDNFSRKIGRVKAYKKCFKTNFYKVDDGRLNSEPSYLSYELPYDDISDLFYVDGKLNKSVVKNFLAKVGDQIVKELGKKNPNKAYPVCHGVVSKQIDLFKKEKEHQMKKEIV